MSNNDPDLWGRGVWYAMHRLGIECGHTINFEVFAKAIPAIIASLPCEDCNKHANEYLRSHPITRRLMNIRDRRYGIVGPYTWTWEFHNTVNQRKGKPQLSFDDSYRLYLPDSRCQHGDCRAKNNSNSSDHGAVGPIGPTNNSNNSNSGNSNQTGLTYNQRQTVYPTSSSSSFPNQPSANHVPYYNLSDIRTPRRQRYRRR